MKTVILVRHGKSSWDYEVSDKDRPLKERGINDAQIVAKKFKTEDIEMDFAYSSPANRALHTSMIFLRNLEYDLGNFQVDESLYDFSGQSVKTFVEGLDNKMSTVMIFGHNYAFTNLANTWGDQYIENVPTSGLVQIKFETDQWSKISKGITETIIFPKQLKQ
ncbi:histidine phosphatase family protein [Flagellimonas aquimarina]|jgi:phosphohistidine phosphatase|uniref:phosphoglycerate mutase (2,3-diphosphoglycerate-dependent) n=1 Tax=Flagellimonas aquimarina TaxID=2201895 RepID=A0A316KV10_9FLAO|nr:histidine phosphatase family protein [Allomuricauda koreensis]PWL37584.1 histidine phosphatase family protein [Allomuricauda koreensis]